METKKDNISLDDLLSDFEFDIEKIRQESSDWRERKGVTIHLPERYQEKYKRIQGLTNRKYHDQLRRLLMKVIDLTKVPEAS